MKTILGLFLEAARLWSATAANPAAPVAAFHASASETLAFSYLNRLFYRSTVPFRALINRSAGAQSSYPQNAGNVEVLQIRRL